MKFKLTFPTSYDEITLQQYQEITALEDQYDSDIHRVMAAIRILTKADEKQLMQISSKDIPRIEKVLAWLKTPPEKTEVRDRFTMDGVEYGLVPDMDNLTVGEFADLENQCEEADKNMHEILAILYRPVVRTVSNWYEIEPYRPSVEKGKAMLNAPFGVAVSLMVFFSVIERELVMSSPQYSQVQAQVLSQLNGDGIK
tara:strand:- start:7133 stop:7726 length:594 start_codon:yes stop_codon:yes gene_type:complete